VNAFSVGIYNLTRLKGDPHRNGGHRTFTHTAVFAALAGTITTSLVLLNNPWVTGALLSLRRAGRARAAARVGHARHTFVVIVLSVWSPGSAGSGCTREPPGAVVRVAVIVAACALRRRRDHDAARSCGRSRSATPVYPIGLPKRCVTHRRAGGDAVRRAAVHGALDLARRAHLQQLHVFGWLDHIPLVRTSAWPSPCQH